MMVDQQLHDAVLSIANYRERKLLQAGQTVSAADSAMSRLRVRSKVSAVGFILALSGSLLTPFAAVYSTPTGTVPPLAVFGCVIPPLCIMYSRQEIIQHLTRIEAILNALPTRVANDNHCRV